MSWPSFLRGIIDRFKKGEGDSDNGIRVKETEEPRSRGRDCSRNQERGRDPPPPEAWTPTTRTTRGHRRHGRVRGLQRHQQHWEQRPPQPWRGTRWKGYKFTVRCSSVLWHRANDHVPTDYVSNFFYQCHGGLKSVGPTHLSRKSHWG